MGPHQHKKLRHGKENNIKMKKEPTIWEYVFANILHKVLISKIHKELTSPPQDNRQPNLKMGKGP